MRYFIIAILLVLSLYSQVFAANLQYINGLYTNKNCDYFSNELKKSWEQIPESEKNDFLAKLADCSVDRGQLEFAESLFRNLEKKNYNSSILNQAKAKLDLSRSDFKKITDDFEQRRPTKATFQYYIYVAQSYYEQESYDNSLKILNYISPDKLTEYQKNIIRYWKAKNYFLKDDYEKTTYFLDLILDGDERNWITDAATVLKNAVFTKYRPFRAVLYLNATYDDNTNKESVADSVTEDEQPNSFIIDGTYRVNPSFDFYLLKNKTTKKYINLDLNFAWSSKESENQSQTYTLKYRSSKKQGTRNTFSWDLGFTKSEFQFQESSDDAFVRLGLFHLLTADKFITTFYRHSRNVRSFDRSSHSLAISLFSIYDAQLIYGTVTQTQVFAESADYSFDGSTTPIVTNGTVFSNYGITTLDLAHSIDLSDRHSFRTQLSFANIAYAAEDLPAGSESLTNSTAKRSDQTYGLSFVYTNKYSDDTNIELFATKIMGTTRGHQGYLTNGEFINKNYTANQVGINIDWTYE